MLQDLAKQFLHVKIVKGRDRNDGFGIHDLFPAIHELFHFRLHNQVYFVDGQQYRYFRMPDLFHIWQLCIGDFLYIGEVQDYIGIGEGSTYGLHHILLQSVSRLNDTGGVREHNLVILPRHNAQNPVPGGLRLGCYNRQFLAHQPIHKGRFTDIGITDYINKA